MSHSVAVRRNGTGLGSQGGSLEQQVVVGYESQVPAMVQEITLEPDEDSLAVEEVIQESSEVAQNDDLSLNFTSSELMALPDLQELDWLLDETSFEKDGSSIVDEILAEVGGPGNSAPEENFGFYSSSISTDTLCNQTAVSSSHSSTTSFVTPLSLNYTSGDSLLGELGLDLELNSKSEADHSKEYDDVFDFMDRECAYIDASDIVRSPLSCASPPNKSACLSPSGSSSGYDSDCNMTPGEDPFLFNEDLNLFSMAGETLTELFPSLY